MHRLRSGNEPTNENRDSKKGGPDDLLVPDSARERQPLKNVIGAAARVTGWIDRPRLYANLLPISAILVDNLPTTILQG
jgi:hypothetical protein